MKSLKFKHEELVGLAQVLTTKVDKKDLDEDTRFAILFVQCMANYTVQFKEGDFDKLALRIQQSQKK